MTDLKILLLDIEVGPHTAYVWGLWDVNVALNQIKDTGTTICYAAKWLGQKNVIFDSLHNHKGNHKKMLSGIHKLLDEADIVIHYNGLRFDVPTLNKDFILNGLKPPSPYKQIDLLQVTKRQFRFASNKLDFVSQKLGLGSKTDHEGFTLWLKCLDNDPKAWKTMEKYNRNDVVLLENLYNKLLPWIPKHPGRSTKEEVCPSCGSHHLQKRGTATNKTGTYQRYQCTDCGTWSSGEIITKHKKKYKQL